ncbi:hypothetical protein M8J77_009229 [Diaphorina citri]|nr:hypothetical protein M8J77_009229 [Diaphorina citri]
MAQILLDNRMMSKQEYEVTAQFTPVGNESSLIHTYLVQRSGLVVGTKQAGTKSACVAARRRPPQQVQCRLADILRALASSRMHFRGHNRRRARVRKAVEHGWTSPSRRVKQFDIGTRARLQTTYVPGGAL